MSRVPLCDDTDLSGFFDYLRAVRVDEDAVARIVAEEAALAAKTRADELARFGKVLDDIFEAEIRRREVVARKPLKIPKADMAAIRTRQRAPTAAEAAELERRDVLKKMRAENRPKRAPAPRRTKGVKRGKAAAPAAGAGPAGEPDAKRVCVGEEREKKEEGEKKKEPAAMPAEMMKKVKNLDRCRRLVESYVAFEARHAGDALRMDDKGRYQKLVFGRADVPAGERTAPDFAAPFSLDWTVKDRARIMIIADGPSRHECEEGRLFVGPPGEKLTEILSMFGDHVVFTTSAMRTRVVGGNGRDRAPTGDEMQSHAWLLRREIDILRPDVIIPVGRMAHALVMCDFNTEKVVTKLAENWSMEKVSGTPETVSLRHGGDVVVVPMLHPAVAIRRGWNLYERNSKNQHYYAVIAGIVREHLSTVRKGWTITSYFSRKK